MIEACILLGSPATWQSDLIIQTMLGPLMLRDTGKHPVELREMVTSPGGTTIAAIRHLEQAGVRAAFLNAIDAARLVERGTGPGRTAASSSRRIGEQGPSTWPWRGSFRRLVA
jgi:pyrroline-5-carboxylate reductase